MANLINRFSIDSVEARRVEFHWVALCAENVANNLSRFVGMRMELF